MSLFPAFTPPTRAQPKALPLYTDTDWDFTHDCPVMEGGQPVPVSGLRAVAVWCFNAIQMVRGRWIGWSENYGADVLEMAGQPYDASVTRSEAERTIREALTASPYVTGAEVQTISLQDATLTATVAVQTIYGEVMIHV